MCKPTGLPGKNSERSLSRGGLWHIRGRPERLGPSPNSFLNQRQQTKRSELNVPLPLDSQKSCLHFMNWNLDQCTPHRESLPLIILKLHSSSCQQKSALAAYKCTLDCSVLEWPARFVKVWRFRVNPDQFSITIGRYWCNLIKNSRVCSSQIKVLSVIICTICQLFIYAIVLLFPVISSSLNKCQIWSTQLWIIKSNLIFSSLIVLFDSQIQCGCKTGCKQCFMLALVPRCWNNG